jgi:spermidine synthase
VSPLLALACVFSGAAALVFQILWSRQLALVLGSSSHAVAVVLSSFMAGLGLGNALAARGLRRSARSASPARLARLYAALEGLIALSGLLLPLAFSQAPSLLRPLYGEAGGPAFRAGAAALSFLLLVLPTAAMGATLPVLVALARPALERAAAASGTLYSANTVGAVAGALATPLVFLPAWGVTRTGFVGAAANVAAALFAIRATQAAPAPSVAEPETAGDERLTRAGTLALAVSFLSGLGALAHETAWARAASLLVGPTPYAFAFVVSSVIAGLAVGSALGARVADGIRQPGAALALVQAGIVVCALATVPLVGALPIAVGEATRAFAARPSALLLREGAATAAVLLPPSLLFGASFPLAVRIVSRATGRAGAAVGRILACNTAGALLGPLAAGFVLLPSAGLQTTLQAAAAVHALAALVAVAADRVTARSRGLQAAVLALAVALVLLPRWDRELLAGGAYRYGHRVDPDGFEDAMRAGRLLYYRDGASSTISVTRLGNSRALAVDGKVDATNSGDMTTQSLLAHLPLLLHGGAREALVIGLGSGATAAAALAHPLERLEVVEISPEVVEAARLHFADVQRGALDDPRLALRVTDARHHLALVGRRYDLVISQPSNPWMAGVASLFTRDFFALARDRLREGGLFCQWMQVYGMAVEDVRGVVGGFADVFPASALFQLAEGDLLLVGARDAWPEVEAAELARRMEEPRVADHLRRLGLTRPGALGPLLVLPPGRLQAFAQQAPRHSDDRPILELRAARAMLASTAAANREALVDASAPADGEPWASLAASLGAPDLVETARMLERASGFALALEAYARAVRLDPGSAPAQEGLARLGAASDSRDHIESFLRRIADGPDPLGARVSLARFYWAEGRIEDALSELQAVLARDGSHVRALKLAAEIQVELGDASGARIVAGRALNLAPGDAEAAALVASASLAGGDAPSALEHAEQALRLEPELERALRVRALALARLGKDREARAAFAALVEAAGASPRPWAEYGAFLAASGDSAAALDAFESATDLAPDDRGAWSGLAAAARARGDEALLARAEAALRRLGPPSADDGAMPAPGR